MGEDRAPGWPCQAAGILAAWLDVCRAGGAPVWEGLRDPSREPGAERKAAYAAAAVVVTGGGPCTSAVAISALGAESAVVLLTGG